MKLTNTFYTLALAAVTFGLVGCKDGGTTVETSAPPATVDAHDDHEGHAHPTEGPHHGGLIELGNDESRHSKRVPQSFHLDKLRF